MLIWTILATVVLIGLLVEMKTYWIGVGGVITNLYYWCRSKQIDLVLGFAVGVWMMLSKNDLVSITGVILFVSSVVLIAYRFERQLARK